MEIIIGLIILATFVGAILLAAVVFTAVRENQAAPEKAYSGEIDWDAARDEELLDAMQSGRKIEAIKRYRQLTSVGLKEAKDAVEYLEANPGASGKGKKKGAVPADAGVRHLVRLGRLDEAADVYREFTGASLAEAQEAVSQIEQEVGLATDDESDRADRAGSG